MFKVKVKLSEYILLEEPTAITFLFHSESYSFLLSHDYLLKIMYYINIVSVIEIFIIVKKAFCIFVGYPLCTNFIIIFLRFSYKIISTLSDHKKYTLGKACTCLPLFSRAKVMQPLDLLFPLSQLCLLAVCQTQPFKFRDKET